MAYPVQGFGGTKLKRYIAIGGDWDEFSATYNNDTTAVTVSSNGVAKSYTVYGSSPLNGNDPLVNYLVLVIQVSGYITLASGATSGSATVSVVLNGKTLYSTTITNTTNQVIINNVVIPRSQFGQFAYDWFNTLQITVTLGTGAQSVTITQVQYMFGILINGGSSGVTINIPINKQIMFINEDPTIFYPYYDGNPFGLGVTIGIYDPFGITTGQAQISLQNGTTVINTNGNGVYGGRAFPVPITTGTPNGLFGPYSQTTVSNAILTISVSANNSILIGYLHIGIIVSGLGITKGYAHQIMWFRTTGLQFSTLIMFSVGNTATFSQLLSALKNFNYSFPEGYPPANYDTGILLPETAIWGTNWSISSVTNLLNQQGSFLNLASLHFNWEFVLSYQNLQLLAQIGKAMLYQLSNTTPHFILTLDHIAEGYLEQYNNWAGTGNNAAGGIGIGYILGRIIYVEVEQ